MSFQNSAIGYNCYIGYTCLKTIESGNNIERILNAVNHDGFPVVDDNNHPLGFVRRDQLVALLECCIFTETVPWNNNLNSENLDLMSPASSTDESLTAIFSGSSASDQTKAGELVEDDLRFSFYARDDESSDSATCSCSDFPPENEEAESQSVSSYSIQITAYIEIVTDVLDIAD